MPELTPLDDNRQEHFLNGEDLEPITRREHFYAGRESELPAGHQEPETREEWFIQKYRGGGGDVTVVPLSVTDNGTYSEEGKAYSPVSVNVPLPQNAYLLKSVANLPQAIASFNDGEDMVMPSLKVAIEPQQEGSGDPSPENVRPISGWTEANIVVSPTTDAEDGTTYTILFTVNGETKTIYGGYVEVKNGKVKAVATTGYVDLGTLSWTKQSVSGKTIFITTKEINDAQKSSNLNLIQGILCSAYKEETWAHILNTSGYDGYICIGGTNKSYIAVNDTRYNNSTASEFKKALDGVQLVYILASPIEYDLSDVSINTLLGTNNVWADTGDITDAEYFSKEV